MSEQKTVYDHYDTDDSVLSLHDCYANRITFENGVLSFDFDDGFWITPKHKSNDLKETVKTDSSRVDFHLDPGDSEDLLIYVFQKKFFGQIIRNEWTLNKLIEFINSGLFSSEFLYQYKGYNEQIFECGLHFDKNPYYYECQLKISAPKVIYCWNNLCKDKKW